MSEPVMLFGSGFAAGLLWGALLTVFCLLGRRI